MREAYSLNAEAQAAAFVADPDAALRGLGEPVLLDEWQEVPGVVGAARRAVDADPRPNRFYLAGSVRAELDTEVWPGTGRFLRLAMHPMTVRERAGAPSGKLFIDTHDVAELEDSATRRRDPERLRRYFEAYALNSAGVAEHKTIFEAAGVTKVTGMAYEDLLTRLLIVDRMPAWTSNRLKRLVRTPKRYVVDAALIAAALRLSAQGVLRDGDLLGRIKAAAAPTAADARHLTWLKAELGDRFVAGIVLHTGPQVYELADAIIAAPISTIWS
jgi:uncharacterized protein